nr:PREDICTED: uncharacterized protein LOC108196294 [Daucus carota subsp. sativus]
MQLSQFLMGLNDTFTSTRGHIMLMKPLPDLSQAYAMLLQDENQRDSANQLTLTSEHTAMNVKLPTAKSKFTAKKEEKKGSDLTCDYCKMSGHTRDKCFALHGYPEWHRLHGQPKPKIRNQPNKQSTVNSAQIKPDAPESITDVKTSSALSETQCQQIMQMIQAQLQPAAANNAPWIHNATGNTVAGLSYEEGERDW